MFGHITFAERRALCVRPRYLHVNLSYYQQLPRHFEFAKDGISELKMLMRSRQLLLLMSVGLNVVTGLYAVCLECTRPCPSQLGPPICPPDGTNQARTPLYHPRKQFFSCGRNWNRPTIQAYLANLRDIGCPEQTIRDIIIADVNALYAKRRLAEIPTPGPGEWWRAEPDTNFVQEANVKAATLEQERRALLAHFARPQLWTPRTPAPPVLVALNGQVLGELTPRKRRTWCRTSSRVRNERTQAYIDAPKNRRQAGRSPPPSLAWARKYAPNLPKPSPRRNSRNSCCAIRTTPRPCARSCRALK